MKRAHDQALRDEACDTRQSFVVRAPAGSGKTSLLTHRFLCLLARVEQPEEVVAITFTKKAAAEMRARIVTQLQLAATHTVTGDSVSEILTVASKVVERDRRLGWRLLEQPMRLRVETIDALCAGLVRRLGWRSGLGSEMTPLEDATQFYRLAARAVFASIDENETQWRDDVIAFLGVLDNNVSKFEQSIIRLLGRRDQWLRHTASLITLGSSARQVLEQTWYDCSKQTLLGIRECFGPPTMRLMEEIAYALGYTQENATNPTADPLELKHWRALAQYLVTKSGEPKKSFLNKTQLAQHSSEFAQSVTDLVALLKESPVHNQALQTLARLPPAKFTDQQWANLSSAVRVAQLAVAMLRVQFSQSNKVDFVELASAAVAALGEPENPTDLALSTDYRISHLLVDEFQDTSTVQTDLLVRLTAGWSPDDGRTLFIVGDPMQSIYRFREADVGLYMHMQNRGLGGLKPKSITLSANFRSSASVVNWVNRVFPSVFGESEDFRLGAVTYAPSTVERDDLPGDGVHIHPLVAADRLEQARAVADVINQLLLDPSYQSIAVLVRSRSHLRPLLDVLDGQSIPYHGVGLMPLQLLPIVQDLLALTRAIIYPTDRIAWLSVLRSPMIGLSLEDLECLAGDRNSSLVECITSDSLNGQLSDDANRRLTRLRAVLAHRFDEFERVPIAEWIESVWLRLGGPASIEESQLEHAQAVFSLLSQWQSSSSELDIDWLVSSLEKRFASTGIESARLEVMTIHGAKGLEFDAVVLPSLERLAGNDQQEVFSWLEQTDQADRQSLLMAPLHADTESAQAFYQYLRNIESEKMHNETSRLLYVAATRARRCLHLLGNVKLSRKGELVTPPRGSFLRKLWPLLFSDYEEQMASVTISPDVSDNDRQTIPSLALRRLPSDYIAANLLAGLELAIDDDQEPIEFDWAGVSAKHVGSVVHDELRRLSQIPDRSVSSIASRQLVWPRLLTSMGVTSNNLTQSVERIKDALLKVLDDERGCWLINPAHEQAQSEYAVSGTLDDRIVNAVIDRTFVDNGVRWIVDYKTGRHLGAALDDFLDREQIRYEGQLQNYARLLTAMDSRPIRLGLYFPLHVAWREWAFVPE